MIARSSLQACAALAALFVVGLVAACGGHPPPPPRGVIEGDVGDWKFRRYQEVLDVEVVIEGNRGVAYTATYARGEAEKANHLTDQDLATAFVTRYDTDDNVVRSTVVFVRRLAQEAGYQVEETKLGGVRLVLITGHGEAWALWSAARHVVKIGGHGRDDVPEGLVSSYGDRYPSTLTADVLEGPLPPGADAPEGDDGDAKPEYDPDHPRPDLDKYDPNTKLPGKHGDGDGDDQDGDD